MEMPSPPYKTRHLKKSGEFVAALTPEKIEAFIAPVYSEHFGDDVTPDSVQRLADAYDQGERDLVPIQERLDALTIAEAEGWTPTRNIENQLEHLRNVVCGRYVSKYLKDILATLQEAESDLATWPAQRAKRLIDREIEDAKAEVRRKQQAEISAKRDAFYRAFYAKGIAPIPIGAETIAESARALNEAERKISNMGNHLYG